MSPSCIISVMVCPTAKILFENYASAAIVAALLHGTNRIANLTATVLNGADWRSKNR